MSDLISRFRANARGRRAEIFLSSFQLTRSTTILDLGGHNGTHIAGVLKGTSIAPENVYIADISREAIESAQAQFGYNPVLVKESGPLPFPPKSFDIVFCSSVFEHVTIPKEIVWTLRSGREFRKRALERQKEFANEIMRVGRGFFVQTPYRYFPVEAHSLLPFAALLPRRLLVSLLRFTNRFWIKATTPDWHLLTRRQLSRLFPGASILEEKCFGLTKSIIALGK